MLEHVVDELQRSPLVRVNLLSDHRHVGLLEAHAGLGGPRVCAREAVQHRHFSGLTTLGITCSAASKYAGGDRGRFRAHQSEIHGSGTRAIGDSLRAHEAPETSGSQVCPGCAPYTRATKVRVRLEPDGEAGEQS